MFVDDYSSETQVKMACHDFYLLSEFLLIYFHYIQQVCWK